MEDGLSCKCVSHSGKQKGANTEFLEILKCQVDKESQHEKCCEEANQGQRQHVGDVLEADKRQWLEKLKQTLMPLGSHIRQRENDKATCGDVDTASKHTKTHASKDSESILILG